jgi:hypothetical protein
MLKIINLIRYLSDLENENEKNKVLGGLVAEASLARVDGEIGELTEVEFSVFSQYGEDGVLAWLIHRLPGIPKVSIEFGVEDFKEANTRFLAFKSWRCHVFDRSKKNIQKLRNSTLSWKYNVYSNTASIEPENVNALFMAAGIPTEVGVISVDIDSNDYWVLEALEFKSWILVCEYNSLFGDKLPLAVPYQENFDRLDEANQSVYFGASLRAIVNLADSKGYSFCGTSSSGVNAFFVRKDKFAEVRGYLSNVVAYPSFAKEHRDNSGRLTLKPLDKALLTVQGREVLDLSEEKPLTRRLSDYNNLMSPAWSEGRGVAISVCDA